MWKYPTAKDSDALLQFLSYSLYGNVYQKLQTKLHLNHLVDIFFSFPFFFYKFCFKNIVNCLVKTKVDHF